MRWLSSSGPCQQANLHICVYVCVCPFYPRGRRKRTDFHMLSSELYIHTVACTHLLIYIFLTHKVQKERGQRWGGYSPQGCTP